MTFTKNIPWRRDISRWSISLAFRGKTDGQEFRLAEAMTWPQMYLGDVREYLLIKGGGNLRYSGVFLQRDESAGVIITARLRKSVYRSASCPRLSSNRFTAS
jgi:hypothetical protein